MFFYLQDFLSEFDDDPKEQDFFVFGIQKRTTVYR